MEVCLLDRRSILTVRQLGATYAHPQHNPEQLTEGTKEEPEVDPKKPVQVQPDEEHPHPKEHALEKPHQAESHDQKLKYPKMEAD
jgi:hypothetical protein